MIIFRLLQTDFSFKSFLFSSEISFICKIFVEEMNGAYFPLGLIIIDIFKTNYSRPTVFVL